MFASSRQTLHANLIQQACMAALLFTLPNLLDKAAYAETVFVGVLMSFIVLADMGLSLVYRRVVPALDMQSLLHQDEIKNWNATALGFGLISASVFSLAMTTVYAARYGFSAKALLLLAYSILYFWLSFHVNRETAAQNFAGYRRTVGLRAGSSLLVIPLVAMMGVSGWFLGLLAAALLTMLVTGRQLLEPLGRIDWSRVRQYLPEGWILCLTSATWLQQLNFGRLYAGLQYGPEALAHYGVASAAYLSLSTLVISIFLPMTVAVMARFGRSEAEAFEYAAQRISASVWWVAGGSLLVAELTPYVFALLFPGYNFEPLMLRTLLMSMVFYPFFIMLGSCLVAKQQSVIYLLITLAGIAVSAAFAWAVDVRAPGLGAACGQLAGLLFYVLALLVAVRKLFGNVAGTLVLKASRLLLAVVLLTATYGTIRLPW
jgi:O-antigen/teichoic acid export membrane protein